MREIFGTKLRRTVGESIEDRCANDLALFAKTYLPDMFPSDWSSFHIETMHRLEEIMFNSPDKQTFDVVAAPRGHAKSSVVSFLSIIHACCYPRDDNKFILLISATTPVVRQFITDLRNTLQFNDRIRDSFGEMMDKDCWNSTEFKTQTGVLVMGRASGQQCRGIKGNNGRRPSFIVVDDLESQADVDSPTAAEAMEKWFNADLVPVGSSTAKYFMVGTVLAYNSLLYKLLHEPRYSVWRRKEYRAVIKFSDDTNDWDEWQRIMTDPSLGNEAFTQATEYYKLHRKEMLKGTKVLWPAKRKDQYLSLMCTRLADENAFNSEMQNSPETESTRTFKDEWVNENTYDVLPEIKEVSAAIDPSLGKSRNSDTSAIIFLGRGVDNLFYILDASVRRRKPQELITDIEQLIRKWYKYNPMVTVETNVFQAFFATSLESYFVEHGIYVNWNEITHSGKDSKDQRILSLVPHIRNGHIKFPREGATRLRTQLRNWPRDHDDGPDCLEMALRPMLNINDSQFSFGSASIGVNNAKPTSPFEKAMDSIKSNFKFK